MNKNLYTDRFLLIFKYSFIIFPAHIATSCGAPFESHCSRGRWEDYIRMDIREIGWGGMDWINLAQDRNQ
jgi:hypothetical protein